MDEPKLLAGVAALEGGLVVVDPLEIPLFSLAGGDPRESLQRLVTQDVGVLQPGEGRLALLLAPRGQFRALMAVFAREEDLLLAAPPGRGDELAASLGRYLALSKSRLTRLAATGLGILGPRWDDAARAGGVDPAAVVAGGWTGGTGDVPLWLAGGLLGCDGALAVAPTDAALAPLRAVLEGLGAVAAGAGVIELERIRRGRAAWGSELTDTVLPPEAGVGDEAVSYAKGCYIGQETMARLRTYGHLNRGLVGVVQEDGPETRPGLPEPLYAEGGDRPVGELTSWAWHPKRGGIGLAIVRGKAAPPGVTLTGDRRTYRLTSLPLW